MPKLSKIITIVVAVIVILSVGLYFSLIRTSDTAYTTATDQVTTIRNASTDIDETLKVIVSPGYISEELTAKLKTATDKYNDSIKASIENSTINHDASVKKAFESESSSLNKYGAEVGDIITGLDAYQATLLTCSGLVAKISKISTEADFNTTAKACTVSIDSLDSAPDSLLKQQYLSAYALKAKDLLSAYKKVATAGTNKTAQAAAQNSVSTAQKDITLLRTTKLTLTPSIDVANSLQTIEKVIATQKSSLVR